MNQPPNEEQLVLQVGDSLWFSPEAAQLIGDHLVDISGLLRQHALGDPGVAAEELEEIIHHMNQCANESGDVVSAFPVTAPWGPTHLCFLTKLEENETYIYTHE